MVYLQKIDYDVGDMDDPTTYKETMTCPYASYWQVAMDDELPSMASNNVINLVEGAPSTKVIGC